MSSDESYERVYTGSDTNVQYLQELFGKAGISSRVRNDFDSGLRAGFGGGLTGTGSAVCGKKSLRRSLKDRKNNLPKRL